MAVTFSVLTDGSGTSDPQATAAINPTANAIVYAFIGGAVASGDSPMTDAVTLSGSVTWVKVATTFVGTGGRRRLTLFRGTSATPVNEACSIGYDGTGVFVGVAWSIVEGTSVDTSTPNDTAIATGASGVTSYALADVGTPDAGDTILAGFQVESAVTVTQDSGTDLSAITESGNVRTLKTFYGSDETPSASWSGANDVGAIGLIVNQAAGGGPAAPRGPIRTLVGVGR